jgi:hypothetical protein
MPPVIPALATNTNARKYLPEIDMGTVVAPIYTPFGGVKNFLPTTDNAQNQDDRRFSDGGFGRMNKTGTDWSATMTVSRAPQAANLALYDVAQEFARGIGEGGNLGAAAEARLRWYEYGPAGSPRVQAYAGTALVSYNEPNGGPLDNSDAVFTFTGQGQLLPITHPYPNTAQVPLITNVNNRNLNAAGGQQIVIKGQFMTGVSAVTIAGTAATAYTVLDDSTLVVTTPAHAAGSLALVVTNGTGASTTGGNLTYA